jgi:hypothetical protein
MLPSTGFVVGGDLIGTGSAQEQAVVGEIPNLAARLQAIAEPNAVVIAVSNENCWAICSSLSTSGQKTLGVSLGRRSGAPVGNQVLSLAPDAHGHAAAAPPSRSRIVQRRTYRRSLTLAKAKPAREVVVGLIASELHLVYLFW